MSATRRERESFGGIEVPADRLWGAQTQRSLEHFSIVIVHSPYAAAGMAGSGGSGKPLRAAAMTVPR